jgi:serine/threonine-protein kinase
MGEVHLARHPALDRDVAIKVLLDLGVQGQGAQDRFRREASAAARLNHPAIVTVFDFACDQGVHYLVMERVKGENLAALIAGRELAPAQCVEVLAQVCEGLGHAHAQGIIHRDIKPSNILVVRDGEGLRAKITDFGIAKVDDSGQTATGLLLGTAAYIAPERIRGGAAVPASDFFAVGVMLHECLTGQNPFVGENSAQTLFRIASEEPGAVPPGALGDLSPDLLEVLKRLLHKDPAQRFADGAALAVRMRACLARSGSPELPLAQVPRVPWYRWAWLLGTLPLLVLLLIAGLVARGRRPSAPVPLPVRAAALPAPPAPVPVASPAPSAAKGGAPGKPASAEPAPTAASLPPQLQALPATQPPAPPPAPEETVDDRLARARPLVREDPVQAARILRPLVASDPQDVQAQGAFLAALYFARDGAAFDRALGSAQSAGLKTRDLVRSAPFKSALQEETRIRRNRIATPLLRQETYARLLGDLNQEGQPPAEVPPGQRP